MKLGIAGLSNCGKTTLFNALTRQNLEVTPYPTMSGEPHHGVVRVPDPRLDRLAAVFKPRKVTHATVEYVDYLGLTKGDLSQNSRVFDHIKDSDAIVHVVRAFGDEAIPHPLGGLDPLRDIETVETELLFGDLEFVDKRLQRMEEAAKKGKKPNEAERHLLMKCSDALESETPLRAVRFDEDEERAMRPLQFISTKPEVVVINIAEADLKSGYAEAVQEDAEKYFAGRGLSEVTRVVTLSGKIEMELTQLPPDEARAFLGDLGIREPALDRLIQVSYGLLGLISFLTFIEDEVRAWTIRKGATALKAAGKVHSDIERGFIKAEVMHYHDFERLGSIAAAREKGLLKLEGKNYEVRDGDIITFRFNV